MRYRSWSERFINPNRVKLTSMVPLFLVGYLLNMYWLSFLFILVGLTFIIYLRLLKLSYFVGIIATLIFMMWIIILVRLLIFDIYGIPSRSMEDVLYPGEKIIVCKLNFGPRLPRSMSDVPILGGLMNNGNAPSETKNSYYRLPGFTEIKSGDVIVFKKRSNWSEQVVKRCMGLPGDVFMMENENIYINKKVVSQAPTVKQNFLVGAQFFAVVNDYLFRKNKTTLVSLKRGIYKMTINLKEKAELEKLIGQGKLKYLNIDGPTFCNCPNKSWVIDRFGPIRVPKKGLTMRLNSSNIDCYKAVLENENYQIKEIQNEYYHNGKRITSYTFKQNYYFILGDNRNNSFDSRYNGFIAEQQIEGKVIFSF
jgi:signal peptidase I